MNEAPPAGVVLPGISGGGGGAGAPPPGQPTVDAAPDAAQLELVVGWALGWIGRVWARRKKNPEYAFTPQEVGEGAKVWTNVALVWCPDWLLGPRLASLVMAGFWVAGVYGRRQGLDAKQVKADVVPAGAAAENEEDEE